MTARLKSTFDDTFPLTCVIESSQLVEGHGEYSIRVSRLSDDPLRSWIVTKRFREFDDLNTILKDLGYDFDLPPKKLLGRTDKAFMIERQKGLQIYLDALVKQYELANSLLIQRFLDPENHLVNHAETALQHTSMFLRSTNNAYQIVEQLPDLGWRHTKTYFLATKAGSLNKDDRYLLSWCQYGLDKTFGEKDVTNCLKLLKSMTHPLVVPIEEIYANESGALVVYKFFNQGSLKDHLNQTKPTNGSYWKRYGRKAPSKGFSLEQIKIYGRFILDALNFIYENGLVYGHLHSGNIYYDKSSTHPIKLFDLSNVLIGVSSKYRCYISELKQIRTLEQCDVYAFGRVLYELATGEECSTSTCIQFPTSVPTLLQPILLKILCPTGDLPSIQELLNDTFFQTTTSNNIERFQLKLSSKGKEAFEQISRTAHSRLEGDQTKIKNARRLKSSSQYMSEEEKIKRRKERQLKAAGLNSDPNLTVSGTSKTFQRSVSVDPLQLTAGQSSSRKPLTTNASIDIPETRVASPPPPPAPAPPKVAAAAPPPPPPPPQLAAGATTAPPPAAGDRSQLLNSITDFSLGKLKKTKTNDRSAPKFK